jgi:endonuclease/exonuclease/phosphatase (EEP) superfamily protein YafD
MQLLFGLLAWLCIAATAAPWIRSDYWWIRGFDFPRLQIFLLGLVTGAAMLFFWPHGGLFYQSTGGLLLCCLLFQGVKIYPYTPLAWKQVHKTPTSSIDAQFALLIVNVLMENRQAQRLVELIRAVNPDVLLTVETNAWWDKQLSILEGTYSYTVKQLQENYYGMALYSRFRLVHPAVKFLVSEDIPSIHTQVALRSGELIWLHCLHPEPPSPTGADTATERDAELLIVGKEVQQKETPVIVAGDLNDVAWSYTTALFQKTSGLLDPRIGRGMYNSYNANNILLRWPLDHVFHSKHFLCNTLRRLPAFGSDHFPVHIVLSLVPQAANLQEEPQLAADEAEEVEAKITRVTQKDTL